MSIVYTGHLQAPIAVERELGITHVVLEDLLERADVVSLHCPLTSETHHLIDAAALQKMKHGSYPINTMRGAVEMRPRW